MMRFRTLKDVYTNSNLYFWSIALFFLVTNTFAVIQGEYWVSSIPFAFGAFLLIFFNLEVALLLLSFLTPLSVNFDNIGFGLGISLPDEPMLIIISGLALFQIFVKSAYDGKVFTHPIAIAISVNLIWMLITCFTSEFPVVSFKYILSRFWYITVFYFLIIMLFKKRIQIDRYIWLHIAGLSIVIVITLVKHYQSNFTKDASYEVMQPFYVAHGIYASAVAFFIPFLYLAATRPKSFQVYGWLRMVVWFLFMLFVVALIYSFTRAAWLSILGLLVLIIPIKLRMSFHMLLVSIAILGSLLFLFKNDIYHRFSKNEAVSSSDISVHLKSISNVKSDASNAERINRWMSAMAMFRERPLTGYGPGTYMFVYAPFQQSNYQTIISTNFGDVGNAHSEYLGMLSESGWPGLATMLLMIYFFLHTGFRLVYKGENSYVRSLALAIILGLFTYLIHGTMNNYIESDKIAVLWWGSMAILTALDLYHNTPEQQMNITDESDASYS